MAEYLPTIAVWWIFFLTLSLINLPLTNYLFPKAVDRGWIFSRILAILIISYLSWILGMTKIIPFSRPSLILFLILLLAANIAISRKSGKSFFSPTAG